jgi:hypothetical protein
VRGGGSSSSLQVRVSPIRHAAADDGIGFELHPGGSFSTFYVCMYDVDRPLTRLHFRLASCVMGPMAGSARYRNGGEGGEGGRPGGVPLCALQAYYWLPQARGIIRERSINNNNPTNDPPPQQANATVRTGPVASASAAGAAATALLQAENACLQSDKKELTGLLVNSRVENSLLRRDKRQLTEELEKARDEIKRLRRQETDRNAQ